MSLSRVPLEARVMPKLDVATVRDLLPLAPGVRGFWTDDELLEDAGLSSLPTLKKLQGLKWVMSGHIPIEGGGRRRVWVLRQVIRAALAAELSRRTLLAVQAVATLLSLVPADWLEQATQMEDRIASVSGTQQESLRPRLKLRLCIVDMREAWIERAEGEFELLSDSLVMSGAALKAPKLREPRRLTASEGELANRGVAVLMINPSDVPMGVLGAVTEARTMAAWMLRRE